MRFVLLGTLTFVVGLALDVTNFCNVWNRYVSLGKWRELYAALCKRKLWAAAASLARDHDDSLKPTATTLPSLTILQGSPWYCTPALL